NKRLHDCMPVVEGRQSRRRCGKRTPGRTVGEALGRRPAMKNRAYLWLAITTLAAIIIPLDAASGGTPGGSQLSCLDWSTRTSSASTSTTTWKNVPGMGLTVTLAQNFAVQVSGTFSGANVRFRLLDTSVGGSLTL